MALERRRTRTNQIGTTYPILITLTGQGQVWTTAEDTQSVEDAILNGNEIICNQIRPVCVPGTADGLPTRINENQWVALCRFPAIPVYSDRLTADEETALVDGGVTTEIDDELLEAAGELAREATESPLSNPCNPEPSYAPAKRWDAGPLLPWHSGGKEQRARTSEKWHERTEGTGDC